MLANLNQQLFLAINAPAGLTGFPLHVAIFMAKDLICVAVLFLAILWLWGGQERRQVVLLAVLTAIVALLLGAIIGHIWYHPRPFAMGLGHLYLPHEANYSFPSDHATFLASLSFMLLWFRSTRMAGVIMLIIALCVSWARVYVGVHFPMDIVGGFVLSFIVSLIFFAGRQPITRALFTPLDNVYRKLFTYPTRWGWVKG